MERKLSPNSLSIYLSIYLCLSLFWKVQMLAFGGHVWWRKPEYPEKTINLGWAIALSLSLSKLVLEGADVDV